MERAPGCQVYGYDFSVSSVSSVTWTNGTLWSQMKPPSKVWTRNRRRPCSKGAVSLLGMGSVGQGCPLLE